VSCGVDGSGRKLRGIRRGGNATLYAVRGASTSWVRPLTVHPVILTTARLILREFVPDDWEATHAYQQDPRYLHFYDRGSVSEAQARSFVRAFMLWAEEPARTKVQLAITLAADGRLIGNVGTRRDDTDDSTADLGFELDPRHWGRGYATEAAGAVVEWAFGVRGMRRLHAHCIADNVASAMVLRRLGFREEARLREHEAIRGAFHDVLIFGLLREEWSPGVTLTPGSLAATP
jgi:[ribosomal protein S5]-alanine N-acetyltransferase